MILSHHRIYCFKKIELFKITNAEDIVENWCCLLQEKYNCTVINYNLLPASLEIYFLADHKSPLTKIIANGKRFMAYEMIFRLYLHDRLDIIRKLENGRSRTEMQKGQLHKVFKTNRRHIFSRKNKDDIKKRLPFCDSLLKSKFN